MKSMNDQSDMLLTRRFNNLIADLANLRAEVAQHTQAVADAQHAVAVTSEARALEAAEGLLQVARQMASNTETAIKELARANFADTGNKRPHAAIRIRVNKKLVLTDEESVCTWAATAAPKLLKTTLDKRALKKAAAALEIPGATLKDAPAPLIDKDLSEWQTDDPGVPF